MTVTKEQIDAWLFMARENIKNGNDEMEENVIVSLADQRDELVALLRESELDSHCVTAVHSEDDLECQDVADGCSALCPEHRRRALLARIGVTS